MKVLIVDDDKNLVKVLRTELKDGGFEVDAVGSGTEALERFGKEDYDVSILDMNLPLLGGMEILKRIKDSDISTEVIILTGHGTLSTAVAAMKIGAYDFLTKPFDVEELKAVITKAYERKKLLAENLQLKTQIKRQAEYPQIITKNPRMLEILEIARKVSLSELPVLIQGESGVGKELVAKAIHDSSRGSGGPFIPLNCGAISENLLESELFGHEKGAFTGAFAQKLGLLEIANHGTFFLDEIGELPLHLQVKLLRVIETNRFFRVGGTKDIRVEVKFVSATNKDLRKEVEKGVFRSDLYYRISTLTLEVPPLRERKEDIPLLVENITKKSPDFRGKSFSEEAGRVLSEYAWPGNVRELQNVIHRALLLSPKDLIEPADLPADLRGGGGMRSGRRLEDVEREHILSVLKEVGEQKGKAAEILGLDPKTLYRKLLSYNAGKDEFPSNKTQD